MELDKLKDRAKKMGIRVTKTVDGKRVKLSKKELAAKIARKAPPRKPSLENQAKSAKKFIRVCKMVLKEAEPNAPRAVRTVPQAPPVPRAPPAPPAPPVPRAPPVPNARAALLSELKQKLATRS